MKSYFIKRLISTIPILIGISFLSFLLINLNQSDPAEISLRVNNITVTEEALATAQQELHLDKPFFERYVRWIASSIQGDFGDSFVTKKPVLEELKVALPATLRLVAITLTIILTISITAGVLCALFEGSWFDRLIRGIIFIGAAMPSFWLGLLLMWLLAVQLNLLPTSGMETASSVILPALTLSFAYIATYVRLIRNNMVQNKVEQYVQYARIRGLKESTVTKHIFKNSLQSSITALGMSIPKLIAGTVVVENIFAWPGIGRLCVTAIFNNDYPVIQAYILLMAVLFVLFNLLVDITTTALDPRVRKEA
ncbi:nickel/cobalt ABC transporter permease [Lysinibacillus sp. FSL H8-0500]|uniref:nickel/cobalt ABC transporter permease n=1 Tax=Lysinibacillus sp. FSL H8-0500 TaxID=2921393 RepID=UPI003101419A